MTTRSRESLVDIARLLIVALVLLWFFFPSLTIWWRVTIVIGLVSLVFLLVAWWNDHRQRSLRRKQLLELSPAEFEERVAQLLRDLGWQRVQVRGGSGDRGVDITAERDGHLYLVQCKRYTKPVSPTYVRDLVGALHIQRANQAILVTTSGFTRQCYLEAKNQPVQLWDGPTLMRYIDIADHHGTPRFPVWQQWPFLIGMALFGVSLMLAGVAILMGPATPSGGTTQISDRSNQGVLFDVNRTATAETIPATPTVIRQNVQPARPVPTVRPTDLPALATVFNGGNVRLAPNLRGTVIDQIHAGESVTLLGRSPDGEWLRMINLRQTEGWVHRSLLTIDPVVEAQLPIVEP
ncbi:MAG: restriction endonuclease [Chloroflexus sp.]|uniref:restriction endonuclease n=1 Tax=Chloroflexus sp. TaxID=1904827 RepID=UPI004049AC0A